MKVLVLNCGSSSIKYQLIDMSNNAELLAKGLVERIGMDNAELSHESKGKDKFKTVAAIKNHQVGINMVLEILVSAEHGIIKDVKEITAVGHRVAHGGESFKQSVRIDDSVKREIEKCIELAPLHNPANLEGIVSMDAILPGVPQVAVFDTSFHQTMPKHSYLYALPYEYYENYKIRRYGFHGTSHKFVAKKACDFVGLDVNKSKVISCHLGNGASIAAIKNGQSVDTSMGFTPVEGLMMGTRVGDLDLGALLYIMDKEKMDTKQANDLINKKSGLNGVSGVSSDMRDLGKAASEGNERAQIALDMFVYRVKKYVGAYAAAMGGVDVILFTGGIGENDDAVREKVCAEMEYMGVKFDTSINKGLRGKDTVLSTADSKVKVLTVTTNEELVIATDTFNLVK